MIMKKKLLNPLLNFLFGDMVPIYIISHFEVSFARSARNTARLAIAHAVSVTKMSKTVATTAACRARLGKHAAI